MELFKTEHLDFWYSDMKVEGAFQEKPTLCDINFSVQQGEFILVVGSSGSGKTTFLRHLKPQLTPYGKRQGHIYYKGKELTDLPERESAFEIGYVMQSPDNQIVTDKVWHELAFGVENMGLDKQTMRLRVAELASFFGIQEWFHQDTDLLSGGQKQLLNLASIMVMQPKVLLLDEPVSQLDPIATNNFLKIVKKLQDEFGLTIIMSTHNPEDIYSMADRILFMEKGKIAFFGNKIDSADYLYENGKELFLPSSLRVFKALDGKENYPMTNLQARQFLKCQLNRQVTDKEEKELLGKGESSILYIGRDREKNKDTLLVQVENLYFSYERKGKDVIKNLSVKIRKGEIFCLLGGNGSGKSTLLKIIAGVLKPVSGRMKICKGYKTVLLCQNPQSLFTEDEVEKDIWCAVKPEERKSDHKQELFQQICHYLNLTDLLDRHPYDLSGGEQQKAALAKLLLTEPDILLLDEPAKGLDGEMKKELADFLRGLTKKGITVLMVSHDVEFCASYADRCALLFDGEIVSTGLTKDFFNKNTFYTTSVNRMSRGIIDCAITVEDIKQYAGKQLTDN